MKAFKQLLETKVANLIKSEIGERGSNPSLKKENLSFHIVSAGKSISPYKTENGVTSLYFDYKDPSGRGNVSYFVNKITQYLSNNKSNFNVQHSISMGMALGYINVSRNRINQGGLNETDINELMNVLEFYNVFDLSQIQNIYDEIRKLNGYPVQNYELLNLDFNSERSCLNLPGIRQVVGARVMLMLPNGIELKNAKQGIGIAGIEIIKKKDAKDTRQEGMAIYFKDLLYAKRLRENLKYRFPEGELLALDGRFEKTWETQKGNFTATYESSLLFKNKAAIEFLSTYCQIDLRDIKQVYQSHMTNDDVKAAITQLESAHQARLQAIEEADKQVETSSAENNNNNAAVPNSNTVQDDITQADILATIEAEKQTEVRSAELNNAADTNVSRKGSSESDVSIPDANRFMNRSGSFENVSFVANIGEMTAPSVDETSESQNNNDDQSETGKSAFENN